jgi:hypothetical protein
LVLAQGQKGAPGKISCPQLNTHSILSLEKKGFIYLSEGRRREHYSSITRIRAMQGKAKPILIPVIMPIVKVLHDVKIHDF